ncbi:MAG: glycosyl hydrolase family 18 protein [Lutisporaceae bacterium]
MKKAISLLIVFILLMTCLVTAQNNTIGFTDVPSGNFYEGYINKLKELNITNGIKPGVFGYNKDITRAEFLTFLVRLQNLQPDKSVNTAMFSDVLVTDWHYSYINIGLKNGFIIKGDYSFGKFEPNKPINREEMAVMIVRALQYDSLAISVNYQSTQFKDVVKNIGYIELAKDLGILNGRKADSFDPSARAMRQEAAAMLIRMYDIMNNKLNTVNGFYAIKSFEQVSKIKAFDSIGYGWSRLTYNPTSGQVEMTTENTTGGQPFYVPDDFQLATVEADNNSVAKYITVFASNQDLVTVNDKATGLVSLLLSNDAAKQKLIGDIVNLSINLSNTSVSTQFDGVIIDFEGLKNFGMDKQSFVTFLTELKSQLTLNNKKLLVAINPAREAGQAYFDGYDFAGIGKAADYVILMAHDYDPKYISSQDMQSFKGETPLAPIKDIYYAIKYAINGGQGVPKEKLILQINFSVAQWQFKNGVALNNTPYNPEYYKIVNRMADTNTEVKTFNYSEVYQAPYFIYEAEGIKNIIWYEDERSIEAKARLAKMLGLQGISFWRLGLIPDYPNAEYEKYNMDIWSIIDKYNN